MSFDLKTPPDARTVNPGQAVTYQTTGRQVRGNRYPLSVPRQFIDPSEDGAQEPAVAAPQVHSIDALVARIAGLERALDVERAERLANRELFSNLVLRMMARIDALEQAAGIMETVPSPAT